MHSKTRSNPSGTPAILHTSPASSEASPSVFSALAAARFRGKRCVVKLYRPLQSPAAILSLTTSISAITIRVTPDTERAAAVSIPTAPAPRTNALDPVRGEPPPDPPCWLRLIACNDTARGSTSAPCSNVTFSGSLWHMSAGCVMQV